MRDYVGGKTRHDPLLVKTEWHLFVARCVYFSRLDEKVKIVSGYMVQFT